MSDYGLKLHSQVQSARRSLGVTNRQPQGQLAAFNFNGADVFDSTDTMDVFLSFPDRVYVLVEVKCWILFREFFTGAKSAAGAGTLTSDSGGASTSGSSSSSTTSAAAHQHNIFTYVADGGSASVRKYGVGGFTDYVYVQGPAQNLPSGFDGAGHDHSNPHTHSTPDHQHTVPTHTHGLVYGVFKETYPGSHSVTLKVYELEAGAWLLRGTIGGLVADIQEVDLRPYITGPGLWRLTLKSDAGQPNGGRLGCDVAGHVLGAIQSA